MPILSGKIHRFVSRLKNSRSQRSSSFSDHEFGEEEEVCPRDVPKGSLAIYVGISEESKQRFVVGTHLLSNPLFKALLDKAADEYGYTSSGALTIPCDAVLFEHFMWLLQRNDPTAAGLEVDELLNFYNSLH